MLTATDNANAFNSNTDTQSSAEKNLSAFLMLIRNGESSLDDDLAFTMLFGGSHFDNGFVDHPRTIITVMTAKGPLRSDAAGAFQILSKTWDWVNTHLHLPDFSRASQIKAAIWLITYRGGYPAAIAGDVKTAIDKCKLEWASLPGSTYGQPTQAYSDALQVYSQYGGTLA